MKKHIAKAVSATVLTVLAFLACQSLMVDAGNITP